MGKLTSDYVRILIGAAILCSLFSVDVESAPNVQRAELTTIFIILAAAAISFIANKLLAPEIEQKSPLKDEKPSTTASRGSFIPRVWGSRRIGPTVCWVGGRSTETEGGGGGGGKGGGGGGGGGGTIIYYEEAIHVLCIGPAYKLRKIWSDGTVIFSGTIDQSSHPSGSVVDLDDGNEFEIYWGDGNGPTSSWIQSRINVDSKWPYICMVLWRNKRLGTYARWPSIEYEIQVRPYSYGLETTNPWIYGAFSDTADVFSVHNMDDGDPGLGVVRINGDHLDIAKPGEFIKIEGNAIDDGVYEIFNADYNSSTDRTRIYLVEPVEGSNDSGTVTFQTQSNAGGANYAHVIYELLFLGYPHGLALELEDFDLNSLSELGELCENEGIAASILASGGETVKAILAAIMLDVGVMISLDPSTGLYRFVPVRAPNSPDDIVAVPEDALLGPLPELATDIDEREADRIQFSFPNRKKAYRDKTIIFDADGQASELGYKKMKTVRIPTACFFNIAKKIAARRQQEELTSTAALEVHVARALKKLYPGRMLSIPGYDATLRLASWEPVALSSKVKFEVVEDFYGVTPSSLDTVDDEADEEEDEGEILLLSGEPSADESWDWIEAPEALAPGVPAIIPLHVRSSLETAYHATWISLDDTTYTALSRHARAMSGGVLDADLSSTGKTFPDEGPTITVGGIDIGQVLDLTGDEAGWKAGRLWAVLISNDECEICFCSGVTALGGYVYRIEGLIRARYGTNKLDHLAGTFVYLVDANQLVILRHTNLIPGTTLYVKNQPHGPAAMDLTRVIPKSRTFTGESVVPSTPVGLRCQRRKGQPNSFVSGEDIELVWDYRPGSRLVGAGWTLAGNASSPLPPEGTFVVEMLTTGDVLKKLYRVRDAAEYTYDNADLVTDFGSEPSSFKARLHHVRDGFSSDYTEITITRR